MALLTEKLNRSIDPIVAIGAIFLSAGVLLFWRNPSIESAVMLTAFTAFVGLVILSRYPRTHKIDQDDRAIEDHKLVLESITHTPLPFAIYDANDRLIVHNPAYRSLYKQAFENLENRGRTENLLYAELVRETLADDLSPEEIEAQVAARVRRQRETVGVGFDRDYPGLGWHRVTKYETPSGALAGIAVDISELKERESELTEEIELRESLQERLTELARTDSLTDILNRRAFIQASKKEIQRHRRYRHSLSLLMVDIDHFKKFNDAYGHPYGDKVIRSVVENIASLIRTDVDIFGRMGGEEFAILLPENGHEGARQCAERIRQSIAESAPPTLESHQLANGTPPPLTVSIGISSLTENCATELDDLISEADKALYRAKNAGRNRVEIYQA